MTELNMIGWPNLRKVTIAIDGLNCVRCDLSPLEQKLVGLSGVATAYVNPLTEMAFVAFDPGTCQLEHIQDVIRQAGYQPGWYREMERVRSSSPAAD